VTRGSSYLRSRMEMNGDSWPSAGRNLLSELAANYARYGLITGAEHDVEDLVTRLVADLGMGVTHLGPKLANRTTQPTLADIEEAVGTASLLADIDFLLWPETQVPVLRFLAAIARRRPLIAVWPGEIADGRARYARPAVLTITTNVSATSSCCVRAERPSPTRCPMRARGSLGEVLRLDPARRTTRDGQADP
jgi:hypothetical protein